jgi:hypothetical protein
MIELLLVQAVTNLALAAVVIKLRRELWPMIAGAGSEDVGFWVRSSSVLLVETPLLKAAKTAIRIRWLFSEELHLIYRLRVYDVAMHPHRRHHYVRWKAWLNGDDRYRCEVEKPRGLSRLYNKAIDVFCKEKKEEPQKDVVIVPTRRRRRKCNLQCYKRRYGHYPPPRYSPP